MAEAPPPLSVEQLMYTYGVDVVRPSHAIRIVTGIGADARGAQAIFGHVHAYARHFPVFDEKAYTGEDAYTDPPATVHFTTGAAGNPEMLVGDVPPPLGKCRRVRRTLLAAGWSRS